MTHISSILDWGSHWADDDTMNYRQHDMDCSGINPIRHVSFLLSNRQAKSSYIQPIDSTEVKLWHHQQALHCRRFPAASWWGNAEPGPSCVGNIELEP